MNVTMSNGIKYRNVSNIFNWYQNNPNNVKIPAKLNWKPIALKLNEKFDTLMPSFDHKMNRINNGAAARAVNTFETKRDGRFSGSRNWWIISVLGIRETFADDVDTIKTIGF